MGMPSEFRFVVSDVFTINGRGLVVAGVIESGDIHTGDPVEVARSGATATCKGIESMTFAPSADVDPRTTGLLLPELSKAEIGPGDIVRRVG
jgi:translation elongation factor EF-Tu-like GTPase